MKKEKRTTSEHLKTPKNTMTTFASQYDDILEDSNCDADEPLLDKLERDDFHAWVEDSDGKVVFDAEDFFELWNIMAVRRCRGKSILIPFQDQAVAVRESYLKAVKKQQESDDYGIPFADRWFNQTNRSDGSIVYQFGMCNINSLHFLKNNKGKGYKMVVGAKGWKTCDGDCWFEWG